MKQIIRMKYVLAVIFVITAACLVLPFRSDVYAGTTGTVTASSLYVRTGAGTNYSKLVSDGKTVALTKGTKVTIQSEKKGWYYISFTFKKKSLKGYVSGSYVTKSSTTSPTATPTSSTSTIYKVAATVNATKLNVRTGAGTTKSQLKVSGKKVQLTKNQAVTILNEKTVSSQRWYYISFKYNNSTKKGWVSADYVTVKANKNVKAYVSVSSYKIRTAAGSNTTLKVNGATVTLKKKNSITIKKQVTKKGVRWFQVSFTYSGKTRTGYILASSVMFKTTVTNSSNTGSTNSTPQPTPTVVPTVAPTVAPTPQPTPSDKEKFEASIADFPDSYKASLRALHEKYPNWNFVAYETGLDWNKVIANEAESAKNVIGGYRTYGWKYLGAFNYANDSYNRAFQSGSWVIASKDAVEYYMDPRNFLDEKQIFQFEMLGYDEKHHTTSIVQALVDNTPLDDSYTYYDSAKKKNVTKTYVETFMEAAKYSSVSPYFLVSRVKQEVLTSSNGKLVFSASATGNYTGYKGFYNFYNIGATDNGNAIANGLSFAKNGTSSASNNALYMIPWSSQYNSIVGGAKYIGSSYISRGQYTPYLQKFNVTSKSTYAHQYMTNVEAVYSEALKTYNGYAAEKALNQSITFSIPVYKNMPSKACAAPTDSKNPNDALKSLTYNGTSVSKFNATTESYAVTVKSSVEDVTLKATTVNSKASMTIKYTYNGKTEGSSTFTTGSKEYSHGIKSGTNTFTVTVKAENGSKRVYTVVITKP